MATAAYQFLDPLDEFFTSQAPSSMELVGMEMQMNELGTWASLYDFTSALF